ncbi:MAG: sigma-70 family RNA polymerase sigma factor [Planctomycetota bacterium]
MRLVSDEVRREDRELRSGLLKGDEAEVERFYDKYFARLYRYVYYRVGRDHHNTEEVVHDTFLEALEKIGRYDPDRGTIEAWLVTVSRNRIRSSNALMGRAHAREMSWSMLEGELDTIFADLDQVNLQEAALESEELKHVVGLAMGSLPGEYSKLLEMKYVLDLSTRDMARALKKTEKSVESKLTRARAAFRQVFATLAADAGLLPA